MFEIDVWKALIWENRLPFLFLTLLSLQANPNELTNGVINSAFMLLFKDSIRLFAAYNEGVINLLGNLQIWFPGICADVSLPSVAHFSVWLKQTQTKDFMVTLAVMATKMVLTSYHEAAKSFLLSILSFTVCSYLLSTICPLTLLSFSLTVLTP